MRFGILTGGGDCPGLNAVLRSAVRSGGVVHGHEFVGYRDGWHGVLEGETRPLAPDAVGGILHRGGTILGTSGVNPYRIPGGPELARATFERDRLDGMIVVGGEGTLGAAAQLAADGLPIVGVPKTIDNDLAMADYTVGFHTAVQVATDAILIPERPFDLEEVCARLRRRHVLGASFSIVVVAEGALPAEGTMRVPDYPLDANGWPRLGGISNLIAPELQRLTGYETRVIILGHVQRGGSPVAFDRILGTRLGIAAVNVATAGGWGRMATLYRGDVVDVPLADAVAERRVVPDSLIRAAKVFFG